MNRNLLSLLLALIVVALVIYFFKNPLLSLLRLPQNRITVVPTATPTSTVSVGTPTPVLTSSVNQKNINFTKTGNLTRNNPGQEPGLWYLTYDQPGSPALNIKLNFDKSTNCQNCKIDNLKSGDRVEVKGLQEDPRSEIEVAEIRLNNENTK